MYFQLTNIIWDESDDHIVPYPEASENSQNTKVWNHEAATRTNDQKTPEAKGDLHGRKPETSSYLESNKGEFAMNNSNGTFFLMIAKNQIDKDTGLYQSYEEQADFVDYGWANIGSFDDLDRMLR